MRFRSLRWNYSGPQRAVAWCLVAPAIILILPIWPWAKHEPSNLSFYLYVAVAALALLVLPLRPSVVVGERIVRVRGLLVSRNIDRESVCGVGLEMKSAVYGSPTMYLEHRDDSSGVARVSMVAIPPRMFEIVARAISTDLFEHWEGSARTD